MKHARRVERLEAAAAASFETTWRELVEAFTDLIVWVREHGAPADLAALDAAPDWPSRLDALFAAVEALRAAGRLDVTIGARLDAAAAAVQACRDHAPRAWEHWQRTRRTEARTGAQSAL